jgi:hypothetical protein
VACSRVNIIPLPLPLLFYSVHVDWRWVV